MSTSLFGKKCQACEGGVAPLAPEGVAELLPQVPQWQLADNQLTQTFKFANYHEAVAFVNATAWISHRENHHPDIELGYNRVTLRYTTHAANGLTENDFICAAKVDALLTL
jgi:4a-hydroxytetrahydrobiopterin dehydratase